MEVPQIRMYITVSKEWKGNIKEQRTGCKPYYFFSSVALNIYKEI